MVELLEAMCEKLRRALHIADKSTWLKSKLEFIAVIRDPGSTKRTVANASNGSRSDRRPPDLGRSHERFAIERATGSTQPLLDGHRMEVTARYLPLGEPNSPWLQSRGRQTNIIR
jgi:hypothetical protein